MLPTPPSIRSRRLKHRLRSGIDRAARFTGVLRWLERRATRGFTVLMYHRVLPAEECRCYPLPTLAMPVPAFRQQVEFLAKHCEVLPIGELVRRSDPVGASARPRVAITFDDGYRDNFETAAPILESAGVRATFFVTSGFVETGGPLWFDRAIALLSIAPADVLARAAHAHFAALDAVRLSRANAPISEWMAALKGLTPRTRSEFLDELGDRVGPIDLRDRFDAMTPAQVEELAVRGHEIGSHTVTHPLLPQLSDADLGAELGRSRDSIAAWTGTAPAGFCYPNGDHEPRVADAVKRAGYRYACTVEPGLNSAGTDPLRIRRFDITPDNSGDLISFRSECCGLHRALRA